MKVKFGLSLSNRSVLFGWGTIQDLLRAAQIAEDSGFFHSVWVGDNLLSKPRLDSTNPLYISYVNIVDWLNPWF